VEDKWFLGIGLVKRPKNVQHEGKVEYIFIVDAKGQLAF
jgi:hypothetical protein